MALGLDTIQCAWTRIGMILEGWSDEHEAWQDEMGDIIAQINRSLIGGALVISALEADLKIYDNTSEHIKLGLRIRVRALWNEQTLRDHQERIRDQVNSMNLLLSVLRLPEAGARRNLLAKGQEVFRKSDESAYSIVPSGPPDSIRTRLSRWSSMRSEKSLAYHELSIDNDLFTARVYKRNYRNTAVIPRTLPRPSPTLPPPQSPFYADIAGLPNVSTPEAEAEAGPESGSGPASAPAPKDPLQLAITRNRGTGPSPEIAEPQMNKLNMFKKLPGLPMNIDIPLELEFWKPTKWTVGIKKEHLIEGPPTSSALLRANWTKQRKSNDDRVLNLTSIVDNGDIALFEDLLGRWSCIPKLWLLHCLMTACARGRQDLARLLLKSRVGIPGVDGLEKLYGASSPVKLALRRRDLIITRLLLQDPQTRHSCRSMNSLFISVAIELNDAPFLQYIIDGDANIDQELPSGTKAVHLACQHHSFLCLGVLIKAGASLTTPDPHGIYAIGYLLWRNPSRELHSKSMPFLPEEQQEAVEAVLGPAAMQIDDPLEGPGYTWAYQECVRAIARTVLRKPRYFVEFVYCNYEVISWMMPFTMARPEVVIALETLTDILRYGHFPLPGPEPRLLSIAPPLG
ncbi:MAG: hypothetical protein Q9169_005276 [Polycauliona sp. 2 TL-2023]